MASPVVAKAARSTVEVRVNFMGEDFKYFKIKFNLHK